MNNIDVSIIIVNYNTLDLTKKCIDSIEDKTFGLNYEIILVDNASTDGSRDFFINDKRVHFVRSDKNLGFGKANNLGYSYAMGKYIFLLNSDTILLNNAIKIFYDKHESMSSAVACLGCVLKAFDGINDTNSYGVFPTISNMLLDIVRLYLRQPLKIMTNSQRKYPFEVDYIIGADLFIRKSVIEECGLFDKDFFMYFEETEMQLRYFKQGYKSMIVDGPSIIHLEGASCGLKSKPSQAHRMMYFEGMFVYMKKKYSILKYMFFRFCVLFYLPMLLKAKGNNYWGVFKLFLFHK